MKPALIVAIDPSAAKLAAVISDVDGGRLVMQTKALPRDPAKRLMIAMIWAYQLVSEYSADYEVYVFLEKSIMYRGSRSTISLSEMNGAVVAGVLWASPRHFGFANNKTWKKQEIGNGNADKPMIKRHVKVHWRNAYDMSNGDQDLCDAACINRYGAQIVRRQRKIRKGKLLRPVKRA